MNVKKDEIERLKRKISELEDYILLQDGIINQYKNDFSLTFFEALEAIFGNYSILLNPKEVEIKASYLNKSEIYKIKLENIIGVFSDRRTKYILLTEKVAGIGSNLRETDKISFNGNFEPLIKKLDGPDFQLVKVSKSGYVNVKYYNLVRDTLFLNMELNSSNELHKEIKITKKYRLNFRMVKENFNGVSWYQKKLFDYKFGKPINI
jgi:hypothetical protein